MGGGVERLIPAPRLYGGQALRGKNGRSGNDVVAYGELGRATTKGRPYGGRGGRVMPPSLEAMIRSPLRGERGRRGMMLEREGRFPNRRYGGGWSNG